MLSICLFTHNSLAVEIGCFCPRVVGISCGNINTNKILTVSKFHWYRYIHRELPSYYQRTRVCCRICTKSTNVMTLQWRHNERHGDSNPRCLDRLLNRSSRRRSKKTSKLRVTGLCEGNPPVTGGFPSQRASNADNVSIWWRHREQQTTKHSKARTVGGDVLYFHEDMIWKPFMHY